MTQAEFEKWRLEQRRIRDRARDTDRKKRIAELQMQASMLCESHSTSAQQERLNRMLKTLLSLLKSYKLDDDQKQLLVEHLREAGREMPVVSRSGNVLNINGMFDIRELAKRMIWQGVYEEPMRGIGEEEDDEL